MEPIGIISGAVAVLDRADVDTDQIVPKQFLKRIERSGFGEFLFYDWVRSGEVTLTRAPILVTGPNFGCGSSREHAVWALQEFGYRAVVASSFGDIFYSNCTKAGLLPVVVSDDEVRALMGSGSAVVDLSAQTVTFGDTVARFDIEAAIKRRLLEGLDEIALTLEHDADITAFERAR